MNKIPSLLFHHCTLPSNGDGGGGGVGVKKGAGKHSEQDNPAIPLM